LIKSNERFEIDFIIFCYEHQDLSVFTLLILFDYSVNFNVNFFDYEAIRAIEVKNHSTLNGKAIRVMWLRRDPDARKICIGNVFVKVSLSMLNLFYIVVKLVVFGLGYCF